MSAEDTIRAAAARLTASGDSRPRAARDPVNLPMIRNWTEIIDPNGPDDPATAPPAMIQVWTMPGLHGVRADDDPLGQMSQVLDEAGYTSVVATNCDQAYHRYLKTGEQYSMALSLGTPNTPIINDTIRDMRDDGTIGRLMRAYFGVDPSKLPTLSS